MLAIKTALRDRLIAASVNGGAAIFDTQAPLGQSYAYILVQYIGGGDENLTPVDTRNELWQVKAVTDSHTQAHTLAAAIRGALHRQPLSLTGHLWTTQLESVWMVEQVARKSIYHAGGLFRIQWFLS